MDSPNDDVKWPGAFTLWTTDEEEQWKWFQNPANYEALSHWKNLNTSDRIKFAELEAAIRNIIGGPYIDLARTVHQQSYDELERDYTQHLDTYQKEHVGLALAAAVLEKLDVPWRNDAKPWLETAFTLLAGRTNTLWKQWRSKKSKGEVVRPKIEKDKEDDDGVNTDKGRKDDANDNSGKCQSTHPNARIVTGTPPPLKQNNSMAGVKAGKQSEMGFCSSLNRRGHFTKFRKLNDRRKENKGLFDSDEDEILRQKLPVENKFISRTLIVRVVGAEEPGAEYVAVGLAALVERKYERIPSSTIRECHLSWELLRAVLQHENTDYDILSDNLYEAEDVVQMDLVYNSSTGSSDERLEKIIDEESFREAVGMLDWRAGINGNMYIEMLLKKRGV